VIRKDPPPPSLREHFELPLLFTDAEAEQMRRGFISESMDDKWNVVFEDGWLYFLRSWTGSYVFGVRLDGSPAGVRVVDAWASRDRTQYNSAGIDFDKKLIKDVINVLLLQKPYTEE
jgi:hypothetical protein